MSGKVAIAGLIWSASILLSRLIGLAREAVIGRSLGLGTEADAYWTAFVVPDFLNYLLAGGALSIVFIPLVGAHLARGEEERAWESLRVITSFLFVALAALSALLWFAMPTLVPLVAPGFDAVACARLVELSRIVLCAQGFHVIGGLASAALQARDRHVVPALAPLVYNLGIIAGGALGGRAHGAEGFAYGVLAGSVLGPFLLPWIACWRLGFRWHFSFTGARGDLGAYLSRSLPVMLGFSIVVVDDWFLRREGSRLGPGAVSVLAYAKNLVKVPVGVLGLAAGVASYPTLARLAAEKKSAELRDTLLATLRPLIVLSCAAQAVLSAAGAPLVLLVYGQRLIDPEEVREIAFVLALAALGLVAWSVQNVLARGFYALGNTWLPAALGTLVALGAFPLYVRLGIHSGTHGLALASALAIALYAALLGILLFRRLPLSPAPERLALRLFLLKSALAALLGWAAGTGLQSFLPQSTTAWNAAGAALLVVTLTLAAFSACAHVLGIKEIGALCTALRFGGRSKPA